MEKTHNTIRIKFGLNIYTQDFTCSHCRKRFRSEKNDKSLFLRFEINNKILDFPICSNCVENNELFETMYVNQNEDNPSHPIGVA